MSDFVVYPAIDLRSGRVVRLAQGDPSRQTVYGHDPAAVARNWLEAGAQWLHVVNLDGAFGEADPANEAALHAILATGARVQFGGGLRSMNAITGALQAGVARVMVGTIAIENPALLSEAIARFGPERLGVAIDARAGRVRVKGWATESRLTPIELGEQLRTAGVTTVVFTDIAHDGLGRGLNLEAAQQLAHKAGLSVIASGGAASLDDVRRARTAGLSGIIVGRALYEGQINLAEAIAC